MFIEEPDDSTNTCTEWWKHKQTEPQERELLRQVNRFGWYVRAYYLRADDSFILSWRLPALGNGGGDSGERAYVNRDEFEFSWRYCVEQIEAHKPSE